MSESTISLACTPELNAARAAVEAFARRGGITLASFASLVLYALLRAASGDATGRADVARVLAGMAKAEVDPAQERQWRGRRGLPALFTAALAAPKKADRLEAKDERNDLRVMLEAATTDLAHERKFRALDVERLTRELAEARRERDHEQEFRALHLRERDEARAELEILKPRMLAMVQSHHRDPEPVADPVVPCDVLRSRRVELGYSQQGLATRLGISKRSVQLMESGRQGINAAASAWLVEVGT